MNVDASDVNISVMSSNVVERTNERTRE